MSENTTLELTDAELDEVTGGLDPLSVLVGGAVVLLAAEATDTRVGEAVWGKIGQL